MSKTSIPKGTRDFTPTDMARRNYIFETIKKGFMLHGFSQIETPAMENLNTLLGKYGDEGDKLLFRILNSGDFLSNVPEDLKLNINSQALTPFVSEKGLRYDLTVPFARFVVQNQDKINFPFKRYQIQPVWRADRPQKGRYREFYQCDADIIGSYSMLNEFELVQLVDEIFEKLGIEVNILINNRKILYGITEVLGCSDKFIDVTIAIDKLDKAGVEVVKEELILKGISKNSISEIINIFNAKLGTEELIIYLDKFIANSETGLKGLEEFKEVWAYIRASEFSANISLDLSLARGLNYYTGAIFEVKAKNTEMGSICGGGRYDDLTGIFGLKNMSGVGISFGADRIFDVMIQENLFPENIDTPAKLMFINFGKTEEISAIQVVNTLRKNGISAFIYPEQAKMKKQIQYADSNRIPYIALMGENEIKSHSVSIKNLNTGEQTDVMIKDVVEFFRN